MVVGGGIAGVSAALAARRRGATVTLVAAAPGASALYAGGMEIAPAGLEGLGPDHPFLRLGLDALRLGGFLDEACGELQAALARAGLALEGDWRQSRSYADLHGQPRPAALVPASVAPGELGGLRGRRVAVVGVEQVGDYDAASTAEALRELSGVDAVAVAAEVPGLPVGAALTDLFGLPAPPVQGRHDRVAYPPGFEGLPPNGFELLCATPSPHGWRLQLALERVLAGNRVRVERARATGLDTRGDAVTAVRAGERALAADAFVLATGGYLGGGLAKSREVRETVAGLPAFESGEPVAEAYWRRLRFQEYLSPEPAFRTGLRTDRELRPLGADGLPAFSNLRAAGAVLGGWDRGAGFGFGVPLLTGWLAGGWSA